ncbi:protein translocase subunit SecF [Methanobrevibacter curvatus]|uniref:Protein-export membrane protein SecF n=1 Tax=Methanobrevibacter curvatus TaxID=49547 RepID=A0A162FHD5_9EURY|nr:protein translocase subunit SecF [Methanobrevibacter curvatus]KZX09980.1 protein-export membrane protein SecF [Methanobrevibacter curvatus]
MIKKMMDNYKLLIAIPLIVTILSLVAFSTIGLDQGIELQGGTIATIKLNEPTSSQIITEKISKLGVKEIRILNNNGNDLNIQFAAGINSAKFSSDVKDLGNVTSYNEVSPILSSEAMNQVLLAVGFAFLFMAISVFIVFREPVPSIAVILAAFCDIVMAVGGMCIFNIPLSIASVGGILMLIGYSVDTDILLTTRLFRRKEGTIEKRAEDAMKTGLTMSFAAIASMAVLYVVTLIYMPEASTLTEIAAVLIIGLLADIIATWFMNLGILRWYLGG